MKVGTSPGAGNYDAVDEQDPNKIVGVEPDLYDAVSKCVGFSWELQKQDFSGLIPAMQAGQINMISSGMYASDERAQQINFVQYMKAGEASMVAKGNPKGLTSIESTCGMTAAQVTGTVENAIFDKQSAACEAAGKPAIVALSFQDNSQAVSAVAQGRADIFLTDSGVAAYLAAKFPKLEIGFPIVSDFVFGFGFAKDNADLTNAFQDALTLFYKNGDLEKMIVKWGFDASQIFEPAIKS
ncbi:ABC transporter substrate-binding protein [Nakamurella antarctica]|uniref:ABC transporter substrate-binding protein n=1 Tax=Nakamurella antarctica TaxID=1902245 RepID=UPI0013DE647B|nr:ABC transporter substrate-binding protein [Nakamurella antarctica]